MGNIRISNSDTDSDTVKTWLKLVGKNIETVLEAKCNELLDLILIKSSWVNPKSVHYKCFDSFAQFTIRLLHANAAYIPIVLKQLLSSFTFSLLFIIFYRYEQSQSMNGITLGGHKFQSVDFVKQKVMEITNSIKGGYTEIIDDDDKSFLMDLFSKHKNSASKLGDGKDLQIFYGKNMKYKNKTTNCFYLVHSNGTKIDISYLKCIAGLRDELITLRNSLLDQYFNKSGILLSNFINTICNEFLLCHSQVIKVLTDKFPYKKAKTEQQFLYFKLMIAIAQRCQTLENQIIVFCFERLMQIDADCEVNTVKLKNNIIITDVDIIETRIKVRVNS